MEFSKYIFITVAALTLFGIVGGFEPNITVGAMTIKALIVGSIFTGFFILREAKTMILQKIS